MITLPPKLYKQFETIYKMIKSGDLRTLIPLLSLFELNGKPMGLENHFQLAPFFSVVQPQQMVACLARQSGKSYAIVSASGIRSMLIPNYHQVIVQPQFEMIKRLNNTIYQPLLRSCPVIDNFISSTELSKMTLKVFKNNSMTFMEHAFMSPDRLRGISGASCVTVDETNWEETPIYVIDKHLGQLKQVPIKDVKAGDFILSCNFCDGHATLSVVTKDASFHGYRNYFTVTTKTGRTLTCTADHTLPTDRGPMRLGEIIDDIYRRASGCDRDDRRTGKCNHGQSSGGCEPSEEQRSHTRDSLESRPGARGLRDSQVRSLTRVRHTSTVRDTESRLRRLLGSIDFESAPAVSLYVHPSPARGLKEKNSNSGLLERDHSSDSTGMVVHGRWKSWERQERRCDLNKWLLRGGGGAALYVVKYPLGYNCKALSCQAQQHWKFEPYYCITARRLYSSDGVDHTVCSGLYAIQGKSGGKDMPAVWQNFCSEREFTLLQQGMPYGIYKNKQTRVLSGLSKSTFGRDVAEGGSLSRYAQGTTSCGRGEIPVKCDGRTKGTQSCTDGSVAESQSGSHQCCSEHLAEEEERRSGIRGTAEGRACKILCQEEAGSRALCTYTGDSKSGKTEAGTKSTGKSISCKKSCREADQRAGRVCTQNLLERHVRQDEKHETRTATGVYPSVCNRTSGAAYATDTGGSDRVANIPADAEWVGDFFLDPIVNIEYAGVLRGYDIEVEGTHNYVLANGILSKNCQDMNWEFIPIIEECMSASINWGYSIYTGTPKTTDNTLSLLFQRSSQAEWLVPCDACGHFNIPNPEHDLIKMIGKHGPICAKCGKPINIRKGGWVHAYPDRALTFPGFHLAQVCHALHSINDNKWRRLVHKVETLPETTLQNECFGWPFDDATTPLTLNDLIAAEYDPTDQYGNVIDIKTPADVKKVANMYSYITVGCDWGGGSAISDSYTAFAVIGLRNDRQTIDVLYTERIPKGVTPTDEARIILNWISGSGANAFAFDNGGAGFVRTEIMKQEGLMNIAGLTICPQQYGPPSGGDVMKLSKAQREKDYTYYVTDKSRSLAMCIAGIKSKRIRLRRFNHEDENEPIRDFLALIEDPREMRGRDAVILISRKAGRPDDMAHAVNFACCQLEDHLGAHLPIGRRYDTSRIALSEEEEDEIVYGPRGDFDRFQDAISANCAIIEPDDYYDF